MKKYILPVLLLGALTSACVDDKGNYDYVNLNDYAIGGLADSYEVLAYIDTVEIDPTVTLANDDEAIVNDDPNLSYEWHICYSKEIDENHSAAHQHRTLSTDRVLKWGVDVPAGNYNLYCVVKDRTTQLERYSYTNVMVKSALGKGFMLLGDVNGTPELGLDMLTMAPGRDTVMVENVYDNSERQLTGADKILYSGWYSSAPGETMWMTTNDDSFHMISGDKFTITGDLAHEAIIDNEYGFKTPMKICDMFPKQGPGNTYSRANYCSSFRIFTTEEAVFPASIMTDEYFVNPANRYSASSKEFFKFYPTIFYKQPSYRPYSLQFYIFDTDAQQLTRTPGAYTYTYVQAVPDGTTDNWSYNFAKQNRHLVYGQNGENPSSTSCYFIVKENDADKYYIYNLTIPAYTWYATTKNLYEIDLAAVPGFAEASHYAFSSYRTSIFYSVGNKLYQYDYSRQQLTSVDLDGEICFLEMDYNSTGGYLHLCVATWDESARKGTFQKFTTGTNPNSVEIIELEGQKWPTRLKIKDIDWRNSQ